MKPKLFIGSSVEGKAIADVIQLNFTHDAFPVVWDQLLFLPSGIPVDSLLRAVAENDFGILVLSPDDVAKIRDKIWVVPRGNVLFEAALFMGKHGRDRCFLVEPRDHPAFKVPSDLDGIIPATYDETLLKTNPAAALGPACTQIRHAMDASPSFRRNVKVEATLQLADPSTSSMTYPKKLKFDVTNTHATSLVVVTSHQFEMGTRVRGHSGRSLGKSHFQVRFLAYRDASGNDVYVDEMLLRPRQSVVAWLALDNSNDDAVVADAFAKAELGSWHYTCAWMDEPMETRLHSDRF